MRAILVGVFGVLGLAAQDISGKLPEPAAGFLGYGTVGMLAAANIAQYRENRKKDQEFKELMNRVISALEEKS